MFAFKSLSTRLFVVLLATSIIPLLLLGAVLLYNANHAFTVMSDQNQESTKRSVVSSLDLISEELLRLAQLYAQDESLSKAVQSGNREQLASHVQPVFARLVKEHELSVLEFGNGEGEVFFRGHNSEKYGDDKSGVPAIEAALNGEAVSGFEFGSSGLAVRAFVPLIYNNQQVGTLQMGIDSGFFERVTTAAQGVEVNLYNLDGEVVQSSNEDQIGQALDDNTLKETVLAGEEAVVEENGLLQTYVPMLDPTNTEVIGMIGINQDLSIIQQAGQKMTSLTFIVGIITLLVLVAAAFLFSRSIARPIKQAASFMDEFAEGKLNAVYEGEERKDEIGLLTVSIKKMQENLKEMVTRIAKTSKVMTEQSGILKQSAGEINEGSRQIAVTMNEMAIGAETEAQSSVELSERVHTFSEDIQEMHKESQNMSDATKRVFSLTNSGKLLMEQSVHGVQDLHRVVEHSVHEVKRLDEEAEQISEMIQVVQDIAEQTNLLALNTAIEAARAGEHGKGFAVVASEVRKLSEQVKQSVSGITRTAAGIKQGSKEVTDTLRTSFEKAEAITEQIETTGSAFEEMTKAISGLVQKIEGSAGQLTAIHKETAVIQEVVENLASISQESAAGIEETSAAVQQTNSAMEQITSQAETLSYQAEELNDLLKRFTL
ncbi:methyl-accepting chemotaxis protein [Bacillus thermotolerans]|uniref:Methyl-accepting chemotaxis protein n=1 Tax=Bacillus thermotolerans TaxID=1221996 RepID=A0A0F5I5W1_BACTR|nr:methyl-accepting chemotaxis protein [Bacillus thermotolerans]KKB40858.1 methyl-accepting chemotaxis protein [Bacillus thermotolerans]